MELGVRVGAGGLGGAPRAAVVSPGRLLLDVVRSLPKDDLSLEYRSSQQDVEVVSGPAKFHLRTLPAEDFPKLPEIGDASVMRVPAGAFVETIARVARSASRDETRPHLTGVLVSASERRAAHGRHRLLPPERQGDDARPALAGSLEANVPARTLQELARIAAARAASRSASRRSRTRSSSRVGDVVLSSRLVEGRFPNYQQLLPESFEHELRVNRAELLEVVRRISLLAQKNAPLRMRFTEGTLDVSAQTPGRRRGQRVAAGPVQGRAARDRLQPGVLPRRPRERRVGGPRPEADQPAAAGPDPVGRRRRLHLPRHADPPQRLRATQLAVRVTRVSLRDFRNYERAEVDAGRRADGGGRPQRRRQDEPARGDLLRLHRPLAADLERARARAGGTRVARVVLDVAGEDGEHRLEVGFEPGEAKHLRVDGAPVDRPAAVRRGRS